MNLSHIPKQVFEYDITFVKTNLEGMPKKVLSTFRQPYSLFENNMTKYQLFLSSNHIFGNITS